jgi:3-oxoacyl-[acyl-carrier protein] reductase
MFDLSGRHALVTGASGGIGGAIARALHAQGAVVALSGTRRDALDALAADLGERAHVTIADLADAGAIAALPAAAEAAMGGLDILVNNAGLTRDGLMVRMSDDDWQTVIDVDLTAAFRLTRAVLRGMMKQRWGRVIGVTSVVGTSGNPGQANYAAAKAGMAGFSKALAQEVASRNITVNCIAPGLVETAMTAVLSDAARDAMLGRIPMGRAGVPEDIAGCAVFLASNEAAYVTGQTLHVNGGMLMV